MSVLTPEAQAAVDKVEKLLRLAAKNPSEAEAAAATAKAMDLLSAYNLDIGAVEQATGTSGKRAAEDLAGGRFEWERDLWEAVAELNFCLYFNHTVFMEMPGGKIRRWKAGKVVSGVQQHQHKLVGRKVNIAATKAMATYLQEAIARLTRERCSAGRISPQSPWATSYRQGMSNSIINKIWARYRERLSDEENARREAAAAAQATMREGVSTSTAVTLSSYVASEHDANIDLAYGEGTSARWAAERAAQAEAARKADEEYTRWAAANPEKAAREEAKRVARAEKAKERRNKTFSRSIRDHGAYFAGYDAGKQVSIDPQTEARKTAGLL